MRRPVTPLTSDVAARVRARVLAGRFMADVLPTPQPSALRRPRASPSSRKRISRSPKSPRAGGSRPRPRTDSGAKGGRTRVGGARLDAGRGPCLLHRPDGVPGGAEEESTCHISSDIHSTDINSSHDSPDRPPPLIHFPCSLRCESMARGGGGGGGARAVPRAVLWS